MFKNLKDKIATQVNKTNQTLYSAIISNDSGSSSRDSGIRTSSISSRDENLENNRSRLDSASSDISQITSYVSPTRKFMAPTDIESELGGDESDHEKLLEIYKNKFTELKNAYTEVEHEKDHIKDVLQKSQDASIKRQAESREKIRHEREAREQLEKEIKLRDNQIEELTQQLSVQQDSAQSYFEEIRTLREENIRIQTLLTGCEEAIKIHQQEQVNLIKERDNLSQQLNEKQTSTERIMTDRQLETDLDLAKQQQQEQINDDIKRERDEFKQKYEDLLDLEIINKEFQETILKDKQQIEILKQDLTRENEQHLNSLDTLKTEYENLTNELHQTKQAKDDLQLLLDQTNYKDKFEQTQQLDNTDDQIDESKVTLTKLQRDYDESLVNCSELTEKLDTQYQEHLKELAILKSQQQIEFDNQLKELREENDRVKSHMKNEHEKVIEILKSESENTRKEELSALEDELQAAAKRAQDKMTDLTSQISDHQEDINRLQQLLNEQNNQSNQSKEELKQKSSQIEQLEKDIEKFQSQSNSSEKELIEKYNLLQQKFDETSKQLQNELDEKILHIKNIEQQLEVKQNEIISLHTTINQLNATIQEHEQFRETIDTLKQDYQLQIEKLNKEHQQQQEEIDHLHQQLTSELNEKANDHRLQLEQTIKEFETERDSYRNEIETLKSEIISLVNMNEENTRRIDEFDNEKFNFEQEINEKDRQIIERDEKIQEIELNLEQTKESRDKLRKALQNMKESMKNNDPQDLSPRKLTEEYEERLREQEIEYDAKLKAIAKEMNTQINEREQNYNQQLHDFIQKSHKTENDLSNNSQKKITDAEHRATIAEKQIWKMEEEIKEKQLDHYRIVQDLQIQVQKLTREKPQTIEDSSQTTIEDLNRSSDSQHSLVFEPTEVDYLKQIILAYMTGTDRITMAKVICAVLRYTTDETSLIIEQEKVRQSRWLNSTR